jgi:hypothetical protein
VQEQDFRTDERPQSARHTVFAAPNRSIALYVELFWSSALLWSAGSDLALPRKCECTHLGRSADTSRVSDRAFIFCHTRSHTLAAVPLPLHRRHAPRHCSEDTDLRRPKSTSRMALPPRLNQHPARRADTQLRRSREQLSIADVSEAIRREDSSDALLRFLQSREALQLGAVVSLDREKLALKSQSGSCMHGAVSPANTTINARSPPHPWQKLPLAARVHSDLGGLCLLLGAYNCTLQSLRGPSALQSEL